MDIDEAGNNVRSYYPEDINDAIKTHCDPTICICCQSIRVNQASENSTEVDDNIQYDQTQFLQNFYLQYEEMISDNRRYGINSFVSALYTYYHSHYVEGAMEFIRGSVVKHLINDRRSSECHKHDIWSETISKSSQIFGIDPSIDNLKAVLQLLEYGQSPQKRKR